MKLDDGAEGDLADLGMHLPEGRAVALQGLHDPEQGPVDGRTRDLAVHDSLLATGLLATAVSTAPGRLRPMSCGQTGIAVAAVTTAP